MYIGMKIYHQCGTVQLMYSYICGSLKVAWQYTLHAGPTLCGLRLKLSLLYVAGKCDRLMAVLQNRTGVWVCVCACVGCEGKDSTRYCMR